MIALLFFYVKAITKGFFSDFPDPVKVAAESIVNARYVNAAYIEKHIDTLMNSSAVLRSMVE